MTNKNKKDEMVHLQSNAQIVVDHGDLGENFPEEVNNAIGEILKSSSEDTGK